MKHAKLSFALAAVLAAMPMISFAQDAEEESSPWAWDLALTSDYVWRGYSQTGEDPAIQAGLSYTTPVGIYVGAWASNVNFGGAGDWENDYYVGYNTDINENVNFDIMYNYYSYPGDEITGDFGELIATGTFYENYSLTLAYTDNFVNSKTDAIYAAVGGEWSLPGDFGLSASAGRSMFDDDFGEDYTDWSLGLSKDVGPASLSLTYYDTDVDDDPMADSRIVFAISVSGP
ncbi:hypothetical protein CSC70_11375 [Pseudoxanthomonas kalamensis DSM 18571]|uniref:TorF family putative porin n=1 Tax=Pseudoxanthomonas kalamensis TaxID=289483 RepID=UPI0013916694|nr:TorF family putative porin [Pseudoxanthomonas kalamensis]KAF1709396.1 hypothetical protein CSC70_11375 [Pseudoxanthomonas kalamensis DSM 18571]